MMSILKAGQIWEWINTDKNSNHFGSHRIIVLLLSKPLTDFDLMTNFSRRSEDFVIEEPTWTIMNLYSDFSFIEPGSIDFCQERLFLMAERDHNIGEWHLYK